MDGDDSLIGSPPPGYSLTDNPDFESAPSGDEDLTPWVVLPMVNAVSGYTEKMGNIVVSVMLLKEPERSLLDVLADRLIHHFAVPMNIISFSYSIQIKFLMWV
jgi:hypothetical protein